MCLPYRYFIREGYGAGGGGGGGRTWPGEKMLKT